MPNVKTVIGGKTFSCMWTEPCDGPIYTNFDPQFLAIIGPQIEELLLTDGIEQLSYLIRVFGNLRRLSLKNMLDTE